MNKNWELHEKIVSVIEKFLNPESTVEHNKLLPVIGSPGKRKRQCDIVIFHKNGPRTFTTIIEVQKRNKKVKISDFDGWTTKMKDVGAQHLVCVSELGFPESIIEKVKIKYGTNSVSLMTLNEFQLFDKSDIINLIPLSYINKRRSFIITNISNSEFKRKKEKSSSSICKVEITQEEKMFCFEEDTQLLSLEEIISKLLNEIDQNDFLHHGDTLKIKFNSNNQISIIIDDEKIDIINLDIDVKLEKKMDIKPIEGTKYKYSFVLDDNKFYWLVKTKLLIDNIPKDVDILFKFSPDLDVVMKIN